MAEREERHRHRPVTSRKSWSTCAVSPSGPERDGDLAKAAELRYGRIPEVEKKLDAALPQADAHANVMLKEEVGPDDIADVVAAWTGIPAGRLLEGETAKLLADGG